ncbi:homoserine dehydrogenase [Thiohalospira sp.]|uniref:homoserine dehydrogenase n=1 Tax=Thiohalospira sp. TaxID=3080549 RepID=UPI00397F90BD
MTEHNIAIVGLGRVGTVFLQRMLARREEGVNIVRVAQLSKTDGLKMAEEAGLATGTIDDIVAEGSAVDIIFDLTGSPEVRQQLREKLAAAGNRHTVIAPESVARLMWTLMGAGEELPEVHAGGGY